MSSIPKFDESRAKGSLGDKLLLHRNTDEAYTDKQRRILWMRTNLKVKCPHCQRLDSPAIRVHKDWGGMAMCRFEDCGQAFDCNDAVFFDKNGILVTESYPFPF